jgi:hypothetical protein
MWGAGFSKIASYPFFCSCFTSVHIEYDDNLVRNVLSDTLGAAFDAWLHSAMLATLNTYTCV